MDDIEAIKRAADRDKKLRERSRLLATEIRRKNAEIERNVAALLASLDGEEHDTVDPDRSRGDNNQHSGDDRRGDALPPA